MAVKGLDENIPYIERMYEDQTAVKLAALHVHGEEKDPFLSGKTLMNQ